MKKEAWIGIVMLSLLKLGCATDKKEKENLLTVPPPVPGGGVYQSINDAQRQMKTNRVFQVTVLKESCLNSYHLSRYQLIVEEHQCEGKPKEIFRSSLKNTEFEIKLTMYSDCDYLARLYDFNSNLDLAELKVIPSNRRLVIRPKCD